MIDAPDRPCEGCLLRKQHRDSFPVGRRARELLELVRTGLYRPIEVRCIFQFSVDDFTRKIWVYFLKEKSETFGKSKEFKAFVQKQSGFNLKTVRSDKGGEFTSNEFQNYCKARNSTLV